MPGTEICTGSRACPGPRAEPPAIRRPRPGSSRRGSARGCDTGRPRSRRCARPSAGAPTPARPLGQALPSPSWPSSLPPQASTLPVVVSARRVLQSRRRRHHLDPARQVHAHRRVSRIPAAPMPSSPKLLSPQASRPPAEVTANSWSAPAAIACDLRARGSLTYTGRGGAGLLAVAELPDEVVAPGEYPAGAGKRDRAVAAGAHRGDP